MYCPKHFGLFVGFAPYKWHRPVVTATACHIIVVNVVKETIAQ